MTRRPSHSSRFLFKVLLYPCLIACLAHLSLRSFCQNPDAGAKANAGQFLEVAAKAGLAAPNTFGGVATKKYILESTGSGAAFFDYNNDGFLDIFLVNGTRLEDFGSEPLPSNYLFVNNRNGTFADVTGQAGLRHSGWGQGVCIGDFDNDGFDDLFVTYYGHDVLFQNQDGGLFRDVTKPAGLWQDKTRWGAGCAFVDYNKDGWLDLFVSNYVEFDLAKAPLPGSSPSHCHWKGIPVFCGPRGLGGGQNALYKNNGRGVFTDVSSEAGILKRGEDYYGLGVSVCDFDNDGWPDIYVACDSTANILYHNNGNGTFTDRAAIAGVAYNQDGREQAGMGVGIGDYENDGFFDIIKTNFSDDAPTLYRNEGDGFFTDKTIRARLGLSTRFLGWGTGFFDYDNDGWKDIFIANGHVYPEIDAHLMTTTYKEPKLLFRNLGDGTFEDTSTQAGSAVLMRSAARGVAFGDYDNDGDVDVLVNNMNELPSLLQNENQPGHWIEVKMMGTSSNRSAIGARVTIFYGQGRQTDEVRSGGSWASQSDFRIHFGLGPSAQIDRLEVRWPSGKVDNLYNVGVDQVLVVREGQKGQVGS